MDPIHVLALAGVIALASGVFVALIFVLWFALVKPFDV